MTDQEKILNLQAAVAKLGVEQLATETLLGEVFNIQGLDSDHYLSRLETLKNQKWDAFLLLVERTHPALAAAVDKRKISQIPTDC